METHPPGPIHPLVSGHSEKREGRVGGGGVHPISSSSLLQGILHIFLGKLLKAVIEGLHTRYFTKKIVTVCCNLNFSFACALEIPSDVNRMVEEGDDADPFEIWSLSASENPADHQKKSVQILPP